MIREATVDDIPAIVAMGRAFVSEAWPIPPCDVSMAQTAWNLINSDDGIVLVAEENGTLFGTAAAVVYPWHFNHSILAGQEMWWWSSGTQAKNMIPIMENWARSRGASHFVMGRINGMRDDALHRVFCRSGYQPSEHMYMRSLGDGGCDGNGDTGGCGDWQRRGLAGRVEVG